VVTLRLAGTQPWRSHRRVLIDTSIWIYHLEANARFGSAAASILTAMENGEFQGVTSELTLMELLVRPLKLGRKDIADEYELLLASFPNLELVPLRRNVLTRAAHLRAQYGIKTPDALILACGILSGASLALTNDLRWQRVTGIAVEVLQSDQAD